MIKNTKPKLTELTKTDNIKMNKIGVFFKRSILKSIMKILTMEHSGFRTFKSVKNINRLFSNIDINLYNTNQELLSYIWCISFISKQWLEGIVNIDIIEEIAKRSPEYDNIKGGIISTSIADTNIISAPEAKMIFDLIAEALQYGYVAAIKEEYISLLDEIDLSNPGAFKELVNRLFQVSQSLLDIKHNTNLVSNKISFNTSDIDSVKESLIQTRNSLESSNNFLKVGIRRLNTLLSPAYMNARLYIYAGAVGSGKSIILQKTAIDIRKYNPDFVTKTPGMKPCVLYITMENFFTEVIERLWNMEFDESITNYSEDEAMSMICNVLGITRVIKEDNVMKDVETGESLLAELVQEPKGKSNIEIVMKYFPYREISTDDLFTIIQDLRDENLEVCALVLDYVKRIAPANPTPDNEKLELNHIGNELKALATILDIPVITAHQLNRAAVAIMDGATRQGRGDVLKLVGREHIGSAWEISEIADWLGLCNITYKPGTDEKYFEINVQKRRRIESDNEFAKFTYLAHPFAKNNGLRLLDDINLDKVLSVQSLSSDIEGLSKEKANAVPRLKSIPQSDFIEFDDGDDDI